MIHFKLDILILTDGDTHIDSVTLKPLRPSLTVPAYERVIEIVKLIVLLTIAVSIRLTVTDTLTFTNILRQNLIAKHDIRLNYSN